MAGSNDWIMSLRRCEKLMAARMVNTVPSAACFCGSILTVVPTTSIIHSELFGNQFIRVAARCMVVEDVDDENLLRLVVAGHGFDGFAYASRRASDDPAANGHLIRQELFFFQKTLRALHSWN